MQKIGVSHLFFLNFFALLLLFTGCGTVVIPLLGVGAGVGIPYYASDGADRTLNYPFQEVEVATPQVLQKMGIEISGQERTGDGKRIRALTHELEIEIDMKSITINTTRVTVNARKNNVLKDNATSKEIINQLQKSLSATIEIEKTPATAPAAPPAAASAAPPAPASAAPPAPAPAAPPAPVPAAPLAPAPAAPPAPAPVGPSAPAPATPPAPIEGKSI